MTARSRDNLIYLGVGLIMAASVYFSTLVTWDPLKVKVGMRLGCLAIVMAFFAYGGIHQHRNATKKFGFWATLCLLLLIFGAVQWYLISSTFRDPLVSLFLVGPELFVFLTVLDMALRRVPRNAAKRNEGYHS